MTMNFLRMLWFLAQPELSLRSSAKGLCTVLQRNFG